MRFQGVIIVLRDEKSQVLAMKRAKIVYKSKGIYTS